MAITYHAGRRLQGVSSDQTVPSGASRGSASVGTYTVITFIEDGTFTPTSDFDVEYLVIGGGGAGGSGDQNARSKGGGGAGEFQEGTGYAVTSGNYGITVGSKGTSVQMSNGTSGGDSTFDTVTSLGGGGGSNVDGGSGGGGLGAGQTGGLAIGTGFGNQGGYGQPSAPYASGGGGGAGGAGGTYSGGSSKSSSITGSSVDYSGGGGGASGYGAGGNGGGAGAGNGGGNSGRNGSSASTANRGSGGGGAAGGTGGGGGSYISGGNGSDGVVIIKFLTSGNTYNTGTPSALLPSTNVQVGSRFEETDTRKMYHLDDVDWKEENDGNIPNFRSASWYEQLSGETP